MLMLQDCTTEVAVVAVVEDSNVFSSSNVLYFGIFTLIVSGYCYLRVNRRVAKASDKHGAFSALGSNDEDLEMQSFGGDRTAALASSDFRTIEVGDKEGGDRSTDSTDPKSTTASQSATSFARTVYTKLGIPEYGMKRYLQALQDKSITTVDQLRTMDSMDWKHLGLPEVIEQALREELRADSSKASGSASTAPRASGLQLKKGSTTAAQKPKIGAVMSPTTGPLKAAKPMSVSPPDSGRGSDASKTKGKAASSAVPDSKKGVDAKGKRSARAPLAVAALPLSDSTGDLDMHDSFSAPMSGSGGAADDAWPTLDLHDAAAAGRQVNNVLPLDPPPGARSGHDTDHDHEWSSLDRELEDLDLLHQQIKK